MPTTSKRRLRSTGANGVRSPCGVISRTSSPMSTSSCVARSDPSRIPGTCVRPAHQRIGGSLADRVLQLRDVALPRRIDAFQLDEAVGLVAADDRFAERGRRGAQHARHGQQLLDFRLDILEAADLEDDTRARRSPTIRSRSSAWRPVISASAISSAMTPTETPSTEISEISEMKACFRRASR